MEMTCVSSDHCVRRGSVLCGDLRGRARPADSESLPVSGHLAERERADLRRGLCVDGRAARFNVDLASALLIGAGGLTSISPRPSGLVVGPGALLEVLEPRVEAPARDAEQASGRRFVATR